MKKIRLVVISIAAPLLLSGCAAGILAGAGVAGATASIVHDRRSSGMVIDDRSAQIRTSNAINSDEYLDDYSHINVTVFNKVALVTGEASSQEVRNKIIALVKSDNHLKRVEDAIAVQAKSSLLSRGTDSTITTKVKTALLSLKLPKFDPTLVNVHTERGNVYIMGLVTPQEGEAIANVARRVSGVKSVTKVFEYIKLRQ